MVDKELVVSLQGSVIGRLVSTRRGARFTYNEDIVESMRGLPLLSLSLPVKRRAYSEGLTGAWFRGLLPEGERLASICRSIACSESDYLSILERIGWECAGAVSIYPAGYVPPLPSAPQPLDEVALAHKLRELPSYGGIDPFARVSLGGYQEKLLVMAEDLTTQNGRVVLARWAQPDASTISTHIIKPQPEGRYQGIVEGEAWAMQAAHHGARCASVSLLQLDDAPLSLVIERFDRAWDGAACRRLHQEDCCQAMGIEPSGKYAGIDKVRGSDPSYIKIARLLDLYAVDQESEKSELLRQLVVNLVLGNVDAHAKNYALLYRTLGSPALSPLYDVVPVVDVEPRAKYLSMRIDGMIEFAQIDRRNVLNEATSWGIPEDDAKRTVDETLERLAEGIAKATMLYPQAGERHASGALRRMERLSA